MGHGSRSSRRKEKRQMQRYETEAGRFAEPMEDVYEYMGPAFEESYRLARRPPGVRAGYETMMRGMRPQMTNMSTGSQAALHSRMMQEYLNNIRGGDLQRSGMLGRLADFARTSGMGAGKLRLDPIRQWIGYHKQRAAEKKAAEQAKKAAEAGMWGDVGELGVDAIMAIGTGGATIPMSAAKWAGKAGEYAAGGAQRVSDRMADWMPDSDLWDFFGSGGSFGTPAQRGPRTRLEGAVTRPDYYGEWMGPMAVPG